MLLCKQKAVPDTVVGLDGRSTGTEAAGDLVKNTGVWETIRAEAGFPCTVVEIRLLKLQKKTFVE
jgi:hypothetical protein